MWDVGGSLKAVNTSPSVAFPRDPEVLRKRITLLGRAWAFVALGQPNCKYLQGNSPQIWNEYLDYLLGPYVYKLYAHDAYGSVSSEPPWNLLLSYELETRRKMVDLMAKGTAIDVALPMAWKDGLTKERFFITPLAIGSALKRLAPSSPNPEAALKKKTKAEKAALKRQKGPNKGKGKGRQRPFRANENVCPSETPDGKKICWGFNNKDRSCTNLKCRFLHVCGKCFRDHPMWQCNA